LGLRRGRDLDRFARVTRSPRSRVAELLQAFLDLGVTSVSLAIRSCQTVGFLMLRRLTPEENENHEDRNHAGGSDDTESSHIRRFTSIPLQTDGGHCQYSRMSP
jgi:hypothetical protein